jgi:hypothetical protein
MEDSRGNDVNTPLEDSNMEDSMSAVLPETGDSISLNDEDSVIVQKKIDIL